jgi:hypothetical protein
VIVKIPFDKWKAHDMLCPNICYKCDGSGYLIHYPDITFDKPHEFITTRPCITCAGTGRLPYFVPLLLCKPDHDLSGKTSRKDSGSINQR